MKRKLNLRFVVSLVAIVALLTVGVFLLHSFNTGRQKQTLLDQATQAEAADRLEDAISALGRYLEQVPADQDARTRYVLLLAKLDHPQTRGRTLGLLRQLKTTQPNREDIRRAYVSTAIAAREYKDAAQVLENLLKSSPNDGELLYFQGLCRQHAQDYREAADSYLRAIKADPTRLESYSQLAWLYQIRLDQADDADPIMDAMVEENPQSYKARLTRGLYYLNAGTLVETPNPSRSPPSQGGDERGGEIRLHIELARLNQAADDLERAKTMAATDAERQAAQIGWTQALRTLVNVHLRGQAMDEAEPYIRRLLDPNQKTSPEDLAWAKRQLALVLASHGSHSRLRKALTLLDENGNATPSDVRDLRAKAKMIAARPGYTAEAIRLFEAVAELDKLSPHDQFVLAQLYERQGDWTKVKSTMAQLLSERSERVFLEFYVDRLIRQNELEEARKRLSQLAISPKKTLFEVQMQALILAAEGRESEGIDYLTNFVRRGTSKELIGAANTLERMNRADLAERLYRQAAARARALDDVLPLVVFLARTEGAYEEALGIYEQVCESMVWDKAALANQLNLAHPSIPAVSSPLAWLSQVTLPQAVRLQGGAPELIASAGVTLVASTDPKPEHFERVGGWIERIADKLPKNPSVQFSLGNIRELERRYSEAEQRYRRVLTLQPNHTAAMNNLAWLLAFQEGKASEALELIEKAIAESGPVAALLDTRAVIHLQQGSAKQAVRDLEACIADAPKASRYLRLAQAYELNQNQEQARIALRAAQELGIGPNTLHPLEQPTYEPVLKGLGRR